MATLVLDRRDLELRLDGAALALYEPSGRRGTVPLKLLDRVVLQGDIRLDTGVLTHLAESGVGVLLLSKRMSRRVAVVLGPQHNDAAVRLAQSQRVFDPGWQQAWARHLVWSKLVGQRRALVSAMPLRPDVRKPLFDAVAALDAALARVRDEVLLPDSLRGVEGAAARVYFDGFGALFAASLNFSGRNRRPPRDPVNACLSLGYTLLHFDAVRAAHGAGLDPLLGFFHRPAFGRESLASDLIEPLRPRLDVWVWSLFRERTLRAEHFSMDKGACLLGKAGREAFYAGFDAAARPWRQALRRRCQGLAAALRLEGSVFMAAEAAMAGDEE